MERTERRRLVLAAATAVLLVGVVLAIVIAPPGVDVREEYSFEDGLQGWATEGTDLGLGNSSVNWSIERSTERARDGEYALRVHLENWNDAGKIWIEREFDVAPNRDYRVTVAFDFATADFGSFNLWRIIAGGLPEPPQTPAELEPVFQDDTGNGQDEDVGYVWQTRSYTTTTRSTADGRLCVVLGVWGTWEGPRTYFVDGVTVTLQEA